MTMTPDARRALSSTIRAVRAHSWHHLSGLCYTQHPFAQQRQEPKLKFVVTDVHALPGVSLMTLEMECLQVFMVLGRLRKKLLPYGEA
jgi:hypothetical protein